MRNKYPRPSRLLALGIAIALALSVARSAQAQAWLPPKGEASFTIGFSNTFASQHFDDHGNDLKTPAGNTWGDMTWNSGDTALGYGITDRLAVRVGLPFVVSKYEGTFAHPLLAGHQKQDDGEWHSTFGDVSAEVRFKATKGALVVTPFLAYLGPSHSYEYYGHAVAGLGVKEGQVGVNVGRLLDPWIPNSYVQARYTFTVPEKALDIRRYRSNIYFDGGYFVTPALTVSVIGEWQRSHDGWRSVDIPKPGTANFLFHDQLQRADHLRMGGAVSYAITGAMEVALNAYATVYGRRDMNLAGFSLNMTYGFSPSQIIKKGKGPKTPMEHPGKSS
jgi:hypothetical protein